MTISVTTSTLHQGKPNGTLFAMEESMIEIIRATDYVTGVDDVKISAFPDCQVVPEWSLFIAFVLSKTKCIQSFDFLLVNPCPVTKYEIVTKSLQNFLTILGQVDQNN